jgi:Phosphatidylinositol-glycan biosynthesis class S protein
MTAETETTTTATTTTTTTTSAVIAATSKMRLLIQAVAVVEMIVLTLAGLGWGLCAQHDKLCLSFLPLDQGGRPMLQAAAADSTVAQDGEDRGPGPLSQHICDNSHTSAKRRRIRPYLVLQIENGPDGAHSSAAYQKWSDAWNQWMTETNFARWPLWTEPPSSSVVLGGRLTAKATQHHDQDATYLRVSTQRVEEEFGSSSYSFSYSSSKTLHNNEQHDAFEIILYVPTDLLLFEDVHDQGKQSEALAINSNRLIILQRPNATIHDSMSYLLPFLTNTIGIDNPIDRIGIETWLACVAASTLKDFHLKVESVRHWLIQSATDVSISTRIGEQWLDAHLLVRNATQRLLPTSHRVSPKELLEVIELLERGQQKLENLRYDPALLPPMYLQMDHTLAIFAPLLFPLLLPMVAGLVREYKHYKTSLS